MMKIRKAELTDFDELYYLGLSTPEFRVSANEVFMDADDFKMHITEDSSAFFVAEDKDKIIGFICSNAKDSDKPFVNKYACLVYIMVKPEYRNKGVAKNLYAECEKELKKKGITHFYSWANAEGDGSIVNFLKKEGFAEGHLYKWMDKKL